MCLIHKQDGEDCLLIEISFSLLNFLNKTVRKSKQNCSVKIIEVEARKIEGERRKELRSLSAVDFFDFFCFVHRYHFACESSTHEHFSKLCNLISGFFEKK